MFDFYMSIWHFKSNNAYNVRCHCGSETQFVLGYVHTAPFSFLSVLVGENAARSHCSVFKQIRYETIGVHIATAKRCC